jgi:hypothetical protein
MLAAAVLAPGRADACGGVAPPAYTIGAVSPGAGASGVARDVGIIITGVPSSPPGGPSTFADVELIDADSDEVVPLTSVAWSSPEGPEMKMVLHPVEPLAPQHAYRIEARPFDENGTPGEPFVSSFTTSEALLEPFVLSGELGLSLRAAELDIVDCGPCGQDCAVSGKYRALLADVQLPVPSGGQGFYQGVLHFSDHTPLRADPGDPLGDAVSDDEPHEIRVMQGVKLEAGQASTLQQQIFDEDFAYAGCFTFVVWDAAGHGAQSSACLPSLTPDEVRALARGDAPLDVAMDEVADGNAGAEEGPSVAAANREERPPVGCSFGVRARSGIAGWLTLLLASLLARRASRRRDAEIQL